MPCGGCFKHSGVHSWWGWTVYGREIRILYTLNSVMSTSIISLTSSLVSRNPWERMFVVQILLLIVTFLSLISQILSSIMQTTKEVNLRPRIASCVNMWSVFFFHLLNVSACICHIGWEGQVEWPHQRRWEENESNFHSVTCYIDSIVSRIHANTKTLRNITCTLVATGGILRSLQCFMLG